MDNAFSYLESKKLETESDYPYYAYDSSCSYDSSKAVVGVTGYHDVSRSSSAMEAAVNQQPVSIAVDAGAFQTYSSGILLASECGTQLDHGVLTVGYSDTYWIVKNSWGTSWGGDGYIRLEKSSTANTCGMLNSASYPKV